MTSEPPQSTSTPDLASLSHADLISRITTLETELRQSQLRLSQSLTKQSQLRALVSATHQPSSPSPSQTTKPKKVPKPFCPQHFSTRLIALKFAYIGSHYNGYEHANGTVPPKPTVEEVLWKALRKARLIWPEVREECDDSYEVVWGERERVMGYVVNGTQDWAAEDENGVGETGGNNGKRKRLELNWKGCEYSKCGRTDRGVSAFGQVVGVRVRSNRPKENKKDNVVNGVGSVGRRSEERDQFDEAAMPAIDAAELEQETHEKTFDDVKDELPYVSMLNAILPPSIRVLAWCPRPPPDFDARFSCRERRYKYFFTNPAFCPKPGPLGMAYADGKRSELREGWLDIDRMRKAAKKLEGLHDFRNLCKIDASKQMPSCERRITYAAIEEMESSGAAFSRTAELNASGSQTIGTMARRFGIGDFVDEGPKVYAFSVHGSAFLWHQVRCMAAVLFLVGQGLEEPDVVDQLLDVKSNPCKPAYEMADDAPLVLWDCIFPEKDGGEDALDWVYTGDEKSIQSLATKSDGKFGLGGVADTLWAQWRKAKIDETLAGGLLDLALQQGDGSALRRGGFRDPQYAQVSQRVFDGSESPRISGRYVGLMQKPKLASLEEQNEKYRNGRQVKRDAKMIPQVDDEQ